MPQQDRSQHLHHVLMHTLLRKMQMDILLLDGFVAQP
jgi:hypothetical protein